MNGAVRVERHMLMKLTRCSKIFSRSLSRNNDFKTTNMFLPNEQRYQFDGEKLTSEENAAAIPKKPDFSNIAKYHKEVMGPESVADLYFSPRFNDIFITSLAKDSPAFGKRCKMVPKDASKEPCSVYLQFTTMTNLWMKAFSEEIFELSDLPQRDESFQFMNVNVASILEDELKDMSKIVEERDLEEVYRKFNTLESNKRKVLGEIVLSELEPVVTFENISSYLISHREDFSSPEQLDVFLTFLKRNVDYYSLEGLKDFVSVAINSLQGSKLDLSSFDEFLKVAVITFPTLFKELDPTSLDKVARLLAPTNVSLAKDILSILINTHRVCPSTDTIDTFLLSYEGENGGSILKDIILRDLSNLKLALFHGPLSDTAFRILLNYSVENDMDLDQLIRLAERNLANKQLLEKFSRNILEKLTSIQNTSDDSDMRKRIQSAQLLRKLVVENKVLVEIDL
ncbi:uncharacterized protein PRCAT00006290001 [Priceomyces carsonii]|uniref:uncharacterized protein n=1 Tax=Priceomyces carsonii TaxID=28549 RepID=UPI002ED88842|nr:unnamed protein product [Priceomyces carsonii]